MIRRKERIEAKSKTGTVNDYIKLVKKPGYLSKECKTERKAIKQSEAYLNAMDCRYCDCNNSLEPGSSDTCWRCHNLQQNITARKTYLHGGALLAPGSPYYNVDRKDVTEVDGDGNLIRIAGIDIDLVADVIAKRMGLPAAANIADKPSSEEPSSEKTSKKEEKEPSKTRSDAAPKEKSNKFPAKKLKIPPIEADDEPDPFEGIDAGIQSQYDNQITVDDILDTDENGERPAFLDA